MLCVRLTVTRVRLNALHYFFLIFALGKYSRRRNFLLTHNFSNSRGCLCLQKSWLYMYNQAYILWRNIPFKIQSGYFPYRKINFLQDIFSEYSTYSFIFRAKVVAICECTEKRTSYFPSLCWSGMLFWRSRHLVVFLVVTRDQLFQHHAMSDGIKNQRTIFKLSN